MIKAASHGSLRAAVYCRLREDILKGRYTRGMALTEAQLTLDLGVSRTPVREAISQLELDGLVVSTPNKSIVVQGFDEADIMDLYEVRQYMETLAAARAATAMSDEQISALKAIYQQQVFATRKSADAELLQDQDNAFHELIFQGSGSKIFCNILSSINMYTRHARSISMASPGRSLRVLDEHAAILNAIFNHDSQAASQAMREHINLAAENYTKVSTQGGKTDD